MKFIKAFFVSLFVASLAHAQAQPIRNDTPTQLRDLGANLNVGKNYAVDKYGRTQCIMPASATSIAKNEDDPSASGDTGDFVLGIAANTMGSDTVSAAGDYAQFTTDLLGRVIDYPYASPGAYVVGNTNAITDTTSTQVIAAAGGVKIHVNSIGIVNTSATGTRVDILDGATVIWRGYVAGTSSYSVTFTYPLIGTTNTALNAQCATTATNTFVSAVGFYSSR